LIENNDNPFEEENKLKEDDNQEIKNDKLNFKEKMKLKMQIAKLEAKNKIAKVK
jgi:hypothetical protein